MARYQDPKTGVTLTGLTADAMLAAREYIRMVVSGEHESQVLPTVAGLALHLDLTKMVLYNWKKNQTENPNYEDFCNVMELLTSNQEVVLVNGGLTGKYTQQIVKMLLTHHGYTDSTAVNHTSSDGSMTPKPSVIELVAPGLDDDS
mgnify:CR=1 FL=1